MSKIHFVTYLLQGNTRDRERSGIEREMDVARLSITVLESQNQQHQTEGGGKEKVN